MTITHKWAGNGLAAGAFTAAGSVGTGDTAFTSIYGTAAKLAVSATGARSPRLEIVDSSTTGSGATWVLPAERTDYGFRFYLVYGAPHASASATIATGLSLDGATIRWRFDIAPSGQIRFRGAAAAAVWSPSSALAAGTVYRLEVVGSGATAGVFVYEGDSQVVLYSNTGMAIGSGLGQVRVGEASSTNLTGKFYDDIALSDTAAQVGPAVVVNSAPTVNAGADVVVAPAATATLTAAGSDVDGTIASYAWQQISGPAVSLSGSGASRTYTAPAAAASAQTLVFGVTATDNGGATSTEDTVAHTVQAAIAAGDIDWAWSGGGLAAGAYTPGLVGSTDDPFTGTYGDMSKLRVYATGPRPAQLGIDDTATTGSGWQWAAPSLMQDYALRFYFEFAAQSSGTASIASGLGDAGNGIQWRFDVAAGGAVRFRGQAAAPVWSPSNTLDVGTRYRVELVATGATMSVTVFAGDAQAPLVTNPSVAIGAGLGVVRFGESSTVNLAGKRYDDLAIWNKPTAHGSATGPAPVLSAGADQSQVEPFAQVTLQASVVSGSAPAEYAWAQLSGPPVTVGTAGNVAVFFAPAASAATTLVFRVTGNGGQDDVTIQVAPHLEWVKVGTTVRPLRARVPDPALMPAPNPFAVQSLYVDPQNPAKAHANSIRATEPSRAAQLDKIGNQPNATWAGDWIPIGTETAWVKERVDKAATAGGVAFFVLYNVPLRDTGESANYSGGGSATWSAYQMWIDRIIAGFEGRPGVIIYEPDAVGHLTHMSGTDRAARVAGMKEAMRKLAAAGISVYVDAGHDNWHPAATTAALLKEVSIEQVRGLALNVSNFRLTPGLETYGNAVINATGYPGLRMVIDTSRNGLGPDPGNDYINPPGRALGSAPAVVDANKVDATVWIKQPGESDGNDGSYQTTAGTGGSSGNGTIAPNAGVFWPNYAYGLAVRQQVN